MRLSRYFLPLLKEEPKEAQIVSHQLMLRAGMIRQESVGIYTWLPLGESVLKHIEHIVADELEKAGCIQLLMPTLQSAELWKESGRYEAFGKEMLRITDRADREMLYSPTCEEMIINNFRSFVKSYKQLPMNLFQIQWKFRDEVRPRFGVMRGREFLMKDGYSFHLTLEDAKAEYSKMYDTYHKIFNRMGLVTVAVKADTGAIGGDVSHEFQVLAETGESAVYYDAVFDDIRSGKLSMSGEEMRNLYAAADELHVPEKCPLPAEKLRSARGIEVGQVFLLGDHYTNKLNVDVTDKEGKPVRVQMGTYGIGVSRLVGAIIESSHDEAGIIWPEAVAPFRAGLINMRADDDACRSACDNLYETLQTNGVTVLYDDTDQRGGAKFASMDLIGLPWQLIVGPRGAAAGMAEVKHRKTGEKQEVSFDALVAKLAGNRAA